MESISNWAKTWEMKFSVYFLDDVFSLKSILAAWDANSNGAVNFRFLNFKIDNGTFSYSTSLGGATTQHLIGPKLSNQTWYNITIRQQTYDPEKIEHIVFLDEIEIYSIVAENPEYPDQLVVVAAAFYPAAARMDNYELELFKCESKLGCSVK